MSENRQFGCTQADFDSKSELRGQMRLKLVRSHNIPLSKKLANKDRSSQFSSIGVGVATKWKIGVQVLDSKVSYMASSFS